MRFKCGNCNASYEVDGNRIPEGGAKFECITCGNSFFIDQNQVIASNDFEQKRICSFCGCIMPRNSETCMICAFMRDFSQQTLALENAEFFSVDVIRNQVQPGSVFLLQNDKIHYIGTNTTC